MTFHHPLLKRKKLSLLVLLFAHSAGYASPDGGNVVGGQGTINQDGTVTTIQQSSDRLAIQWQRFNIGESEWVKFIQPSASAIALNRILEQNPSQILGRLDANGQVFLVNTNGVFFGKTAQVNVGGLTASTRDLTTERFLSGDNTFTGSSAGQVVNQGTLMAATGGHITLIGDSVQNDGLIVANVGRVNLVAGDSATLDFEGDGLLKFAVSTPQASGNHAAINTGKIEAHGGQVLLTGEASESVFDAVVNTGEIDATTFENQGGEIRLVAKGGRVNQSGHLDVSALEGDAGRVQLTGDHVIHTGEISADAKAQAGHVSLQALKDSVVTDNGKIHARSESGHGGSVQVLGERVGLFQKANLDVSGAKGGGSLLVGGDYQGKNKDIQNARHTVVGKDVHLTADATQTGQGGRVIVWSDGYTAFSGSLSAKGGNGGRGGFAEISGKNNLSYHGLIDLTAANGQMGTVLFDPKFIIVSDAGADAVATNNDFAENAAGTSNIGTGALVTALNGANVELQASTDITFNDVVNALPNAGGGNLTLRSGRSTIINDSISLRGNFSATVNDPGAIAANRDAGDAKFTMATDAAINTSDTNGSITVAYGSGPSDIDPIGEMTVGNLDAGTGVVTLSTLNSGASAARETITLNGFITAGTLNVIGDAININGPINVTEGPVGTATFDSTDTITIAATGDITTRNTMRFVGGAPIVLGGDLTTQNGNIFFEDGSSVIVSGPVRIDTNTSGTTGGNVVFSGVVNGSEAGEDDLTFDLGTGNLFAFGTWGGMTRLGDVNIVSANNVSFAAGMTAASFVQTAGSGTTFLAGTFDTNAFPGINLTTGQLSIAGSFIADNNDIIFNAPTLLAGDTTTTAGTGDVIFVQNATFITPETELTVSANALNPPPFRPLTDIGTLSCLDGTCFVDGSIHRINAGFFRIVYGDGEQNLQDLAFHEQQEYCTGTGSSDDAEYCLMAKPFVSAGDKEVLTIEEL